MKRIINLILTVSRGENFDFPFEERFALICNLYASLICLISVFLNIEMQLGTFINIAVLISFFVFSFIYFVGFYYRKAFLAKILFSSYTFLFSNYYWLINYGSRGSALYVFLVYYIIMLFVWSGKPLKLITILVVLNTLVLLIIELAKPDFIPQYPTEWARTTDSYIGLLICLGVFSILVAYAKSNYIKQYKLAQKSDQLKSAFLANMSHEIRTPLNAITGFSALMAKKDLTPEKKEHFSQLINDNSKYLTKLISDILDFSLIESDQLKITFAVIKVNDLMNKLFQTFSQNLKQAGKKGVKLQLSIPEQSEIIETDEVRLEQILSNLLSNAVKFTTEGHVKYGYRMESTQVLFFVEDTGRGIKDELKPEIFNRFIKNEEKYDGKFERGAGIGLSLSKEITELINGSLWFTSEYLKGSIFYLSIPSKNIQ